PHAEEHRSAGEAQTVPWIRTALRFVSKHEGSSSSFETRAHPLAFAAPLRHRAPQDEDGRVSIPGDKELPGSVGRDSEPVEGVGVELHHVLVVGAVDEERQLDLLRLREWRTLQAAD